MIAAWCFVYGVATVCVGAFVWHDSQVVQLGVIEATAGPAAWFLYRAGIRL